MNDKSTDRLMVWLNLAARQAVLDFADGRRLDDEAFAKVPKSGARIQAALRRVERATLPVLHNLAAKAKELGAPRAEVESAADRFAALLDEMKSNVVSLTVAIIPESPDALNEVRNRIQSLSDDARRYLLEPKTAPPSGARTVAFLPIDLAALGSTLSAEDVLHRLSGNEQRDHAMHMNEAGEVAWRYQGRLVSGEEYERLMGGHLKRFELAASLLLNAVRGGDVPSFVYSNRQRACFHIPRFYWNTRAAVAVIGPFEGMPDAQGGDESMIGQPVMFSEAKVDAWLPEAKAALVREIEALKAGENDNPLPARQTKPKPKWYPALKDEVEKANRRLEDFASAHPEKSPPLFPKTPAFKAKLIARGFPADRLKDETVRYHLRNLKAALGR